MSSRRETRTRRPRSSRQLYRRFVEDYNAGRLDDRTDAANGRTLLDEGSGAAPDPSGKPRLLGGRRREYIGEYLRWLRPHRFGIATFFVLALAATGLQMIEP